MLGKIYLTHILIDEPIKTKKGLKKLLFFTASEENKESGPYLYGKGRIPYSKEKIEETKKMNMTIRLPSPAELPLGKGVWVDYKGNIYLANLVKPHDDKDKKFLFNSERLSSQ